MREISSELSGDSRSRSLLQPLQDVADCGVILLGSFRSRFPSPLKQTSPSFSPFPSHPLYSNWGEQPSCCAAVPGTTILRIADLPIATTIRAITSTTLLGFGCVACRRVLFTVRAGWWESAGSTRRVQTRSGDASASKNTQRLDSLVGIPRRVIQPRLLNCPDQYSIYRCQTETPAPKDAS